MKKYTHVDNVLTRQRTKTDASIRTQQRTHSPHSQGQIFHQTHQTARNHPYSPIDKTIEISEQNEPLTPKSFEGSQRTLN
jgi:hypothetical protein